MATSAERYCNEEQNITFSQKQNLRNQRDYHLRSIRSKICVICEICGKKKSSEDNLRHQRNLRAIMTRSKNSPKNLVVSQKTLIFADKKGDTIMNTIAIDSNIYKGAESYAKLHNISVTAAIEKAISLFLQKVQPKQKLLETAEFNDALSYVKTLKAKGGKPIPADENSLDALVDKKYAL